MYRSLTAMAARASCARCAEDERRGRVKQGLLVLGGADKALLEVLRPSLPDLPNIEVDEAHGQHVVRRDAAARQLRQTIALNRVITFMRDADERVARPECEDDFRRTGTARKPW